MQKKQNTRKERILSPEEQQQILGGVRGGRMENATVLVTLPNGRRFLVFKNTASDPQKLATYLASKGVSPTDMGSLVASIY